MADGRVTIKTNVDDKSIKDLRSTLQDLEKAFKNLQSVDPFAGISKEARNLMNDFSGLSDGASRVESDIDDIDGKSIEDLSKKASDAGSSLEDTAQSADKADASIDDIDGKSMDDVATKAGDASSGLDETASSADKAEASIDGVDGTPLGKVGDEADKAKKGIGEADKETQKFSISLGDIAKSAVVISAVSKVFDILTASLDDAVARFDTLNTFPRTMNLLGYETSVVDRSTRSLVRGIEGMPTKLDDIIQTTQRLGGMTGDLDDATETALALNNAFLASGSSAADASRGTEQYIQMLGNGKVDMQSWRTLTESMNYALIRAAESFGFTGPSALQQFYSALQSGNVTFDQFNKKMQELNKQQGGFAELALINSEGIATSWANIQTAISRNVANIITEIDKMVESITGKNIAQNLNNFKFVVDDVFSFAISIIRGLTPVVEVLWKAFGELLRILRPLEPVLWGVVAAFAAFKIIKTVSALWAGLTTAITVAQVAMQLFNAVALTTGGGLLTLTGIKAGLAAVLGNVAMNAGVATGAMGTLAGGITVLKGAITALSGPIGWVVAGIGALVTGGVVIYNHFIKATEETQALGAALNDAAGETAELNDLVDQTASTYGKTKEATDAQYDSIRALADQTAELAAQEQIGAADKKILKDNIDELNDSVEGLNLTYDEEQGRLVASNDAMQERITMAEEDAKYNDARERSKQIQEQHAEATALLAENEEKLAEAQEHLDSLEWYQSSGDAKEGVEALKEENERLTEQIGVLGEEQQATNEEMKNSAEALAAAEESANQRRITSLEQMNESQRAVFEEMQSRYQDLEQTTTNMFSKIEESSKISIEEMNENLRHNQEAVAKWSENLATLSEQGVDQGMLDQLARLGPEGAPYVQELVDATPEQLAELEENFIKGGEVAKKGLFDSMGIEEGDVIDGIPEMATATASSLREAFEGSGLRKIVPEELAKGKGDMEAAGEDVAKGVSIGIERGAVTAADASKQMAKDINTGFTTELMIQSPSQLFKQHGDDIGEGLTIGIKSSGVRAINAMKILTQELTRTIRDSMTTQNQDVRTGYTALVNSMRSQMNRIPPLVRSTMNQSTQSMRNAAGQAQIAGRQLGIGFYNGLNSTSGAIYSLANTIARNAVNRINSALRTRSPSLEGRESGSNLGKGLWLGMKEELRNVEKWSDELGYKALAGLPSFSPLGFRTNLATSTSGGGSNVSSTTTNNNDNGVSINIEKIENHTDQDIPRAMEEMAWIMGREGKKLDDE